MTGGPMVVGVPKEIKTREYRVGLTPALAREIVEAGGKVLVETNAGAEIGFDDDSYRKAGAEIVSGAAEVFSRAGLIVKVKEPQPSEWAQLREGQILFTFLHLAPDPEQTRGLINSGVTAVAYETVTDERGGLPLLAPMSAIAGRMSIQAGANALFINQGGRGTLLAGVPGVEPARVVVLGGGTAGTNAARISSALGAETVVLDNSMHRLKEVDELFMGRVETVHSNHENIEHQVLNADLVIGAVLVPGDAAPKLISEELVSEMKHGAAMVDISIDQGGCFATSHPTTHDAPTFVFDGVVHYCVANMPGAVARTSTLALSNATEPFVLALAQKGLKALLDDPHLKNGLNVHKGHITYEAVARALNLPFVPADVALGRP